MQERVTRVDHIKIAVRVVLFGDVTDFEANLKNQNSIETISYNGKINRLVLYFQALVILRSIPTNTDRIRGQV